MVAMARKNQTTCMVANNHAMRLLKEFLKKWKNRESRVSFTRFIYYSWTLGDSPGFLTRRARRPPHTTKIRLVLTQQLPQHKLQDPTVGVVQCLLRRIDPHQGFEGLGISIRPGAYHHLLS